MSPFRPIACLLVLPIVIGVSVDAGSVTVAQLSAAHEVEAVGQAAATAVKGRPVTPETASLALRIALREGRSHGLRVQARTFRLYQDGRLELSATTTAPTLLIEHLRPLRHLTRVNVAATVTPSPYS